MDRTAAIAASGYFSADSRGHARVSTEVALNRKHGGGGGGLVSDTASSAQKKAGQAKGQTAGLGEGFHSVTEAPTREPPRPKTSNNMLMKRGVVLREPRVARSSFRAPPLHTHGLVAEDALGSFVAARRECLRQLDEITIAVHKHRERTGDRTARFVDADFLLGSQQSVCPDGAPPESCVAPPHDVGRLGKLFPSTPVVDRRDVDSRRTHQDLSSLGTGDRSPPERPTRVAKSVVIATNQNVVVDGVIRHDGDESEEEIRDVETDDDAAEDEVADDFNPLNSRRFFDELAQGSVGDAHLLAAITAVMTSPSTTAGRDLLRRLFVLPRSFQAAAAALEISPDDVPGTSALNDPAQPTPFDDFSAASGTGTHSIGQLRINDSRPQSPNRGQPPEQLDIGAVGVLFFVDGRWEWVIVDDCIAIDRTGKSPTYLGVLARQAGEIQIAAGMIQSAATVREGIEVLTGSARDGGLRHATSAGGRGRSGGGLLAGRLRPGQSSSPGESAAGVSRDDRTPLAQRPRELWPYVLEKAMAKLHFSYDGIDGGVVRESLSTLTGGPEFRYPLQEARGPALEPCPMSRLPTHLPPSLGHDDKVAPQPKDARRGAQQTGFGAKASKYQKSGAPGDAKAAATSSRVFSSFHDFQTAVLDVEQAVPICVARARQQPSRGEAVEWQREKDLKAQAREEIIRNLPTNEHRERQIQFEAEDRVFSLIQFGALYPIVRCWRSEEDAEARVELYDPWSPGERVAEYNAILAAARREQRASKLIAESQRGHRSDSAVHRYIRSALHITRGSASRFFTLRWSDFVRLFNHVEGVHIPIDPQLPATAVARKLAVSEPLASGFHTVQAFALAPATVELATEADHLLQDPTAPFVLKYDAPVTGLLSLTMTQQDVKTSATVETHFERKHLPYCFLALSVYRFPLSEDPCEIFKKSLGSRTAVGIQTVIDALVRSPKSDEMHTSPAVYARQYHTAIDATEGYYLIVPRVLKGPATAFSLRATACASAVLGLRRLQLPIIAETSVHDGAAAPKVAPLNTAVAKGRPAADKLGRLDGPRAKPRNASTMAEDAQDEYDDSSLFVAETQRVIGRLAPRGTSPVGAPEAAGGDGDEAEEEPLSFRRAREARSQGVYVRDPKSTADGSGGVTTMRLVRPSMIELGLASNSTPQQHALVPMDGTPLSATKLSPSLGGSPVSPAPITPIGGTKAAALNKKMLAMLQHASETEATKAVEAELRALEASGDDDEELDLRDYGRRIGLRDETTMTDELRITAAHLVPPRPAAPDMADLEDADADAGAGAAPQDVISHAVTATMDEVDVLHSGRLVDERHIDRALSHFLLHHTSLGSQLRAAALEAARPPPSPTAAKTAGRGSHASARPVGSGRQREPGISADQLAGVIVQVFAASAISADQDDAEVADVAEHESPEA